jgi:hypothetical protein
LNVVCQVIQDCAHYVKSVQKFVLCKARINILLQTSVKQGQ